MIQYCNEALRTFHQDHSEAGFDNELVRAAEETYYRYFMQELEDELHNHSKSYERYFEVLKGLSNVGFLVMNLKRLGMSVRRFSIMGKHRRVP